MFDIRLIPIEDPQREPSKRRFEVRVSNTGWFYEVDADLTEVHAVNLDEVEVRMQRIAAKGEASGGWDYPANEHIEWMHRSLQCLTSEGYADHPKGAPVGPEDHRLESLEVLARVLDVASARLLE